MSKQTYCIVRFYFNKSSRVIKRGLSLSDAKAHCKREDTKGDGWFDGFDVEGGAQ